MTERAVCVVPGCKNSSAKFAGQEYLCSRHWRTVPRRLKRRRTRLTAALKKRGELFLSPSHYHFRTQRAGRLYWAVWRQMVRAAIEAACGL